jgi:hypothetical protein
MTPLGQQLPRLQHVWGSAVKIEVSKPMANLWHALSTGNGLLGNLEENTISDSKELRQYLTLDNETRQ